MKSSRMLWMYIYSDSPAIFMCCRIGGGCTINNLSEVHVTSNQVAYAQTLENERHNQAYEKETSRHNQVMENLEAKNTALTEERIQLEDSWNKEKNRIQEAYNNAYLEWQSATTERKLALEQQMTNLEAAKADALERYQIASTENARMANVNQAFANSEAARHNQEMERISGESNYLKSKQLEFDQHALDVHSGLKKEELENVRFANSTRYKLGLKEAELKSRELDLTETMNAYKQAGIQTDINFKPWELIYSLFSGAGTKAISGR